MSRSLFTITRGEGPLVATAIHNGHAVRKEIAEMLLIGDKDMFREEDPYTGELTAVAGSRIISNISRFEVDLNRPRVKAVYRTPEESWGLKVWKREISDDIISRSLVRYDAFYSGVRELLAGLEGRYGKFVVFDLHSYNYHRQGPLEEPADPKYNPEINIGTGSMNRDRWAPVVDRVVHELAEADFLNRKLDVRENVKFRGGYFPSWIHENFPLSGCAIAIECKKIFMDEWTGMIFKDRFDALQAALQKAADGVIEELRGQPF